MDKDGRYYDIYIDENGKYYNKYISTEPPEFNYGNGIDKYGRKYYIYKELCKIKIIISSPKK
jgi:hypothetical protein